MQTVRSPTTARSIAVMYKLVMFWTLASNSSSRGGSQPVATLSKA